MSEKKIEISIEGESIKANMLYNQIKEVHSDVYKDSVSESAFLEESEKVKELGKIFGVKVIVLREKGVERMTSSLFNMHAYYSVLLDELEYAQLIINYQNLTGETDMREITKFLKGKRSDI